MGFWLPADLYLIKTEGKSLFDLFSTFKLYDFYHRIAFQLVPILLLYQ